MNYKAILHITGLDKNLSSNLSFGQANLKVCLPEPMPHLPTFEKIDFYYYY